MALSNQTVLKLADALVPEVIDYIFEDERWVELMHEIIPDAIQSKLGAVDEDLRFELALCIMDRIVMKPFK
jgi:hypothetical protein